MCGIAGFNWADKKLIRKMTQEIEHRGPDNSGFYIDRNISLGHRRLSIIDLSKNGSQPMFNENKHITIIFNGEIWNYLSLRKDLEKAGHKFKSNSDTEVLVHAYESYGDSFPSILDGMFAFALWDKVKRKLILSRDKIGKKPLYYTINGKKIIFASEIKSILVNSDFKKEIDYQCLSDYLTLRFSPGNSTIFKRIKKLDPGTSIIINNNSIIFQKYWNLPNFTVSREPKIEEIDTLISQAVEKRLMSDVPLGVFLSGGLDSSTLVAYMSRFTNKIKTFSVGFGDITDETLYAKIISETFHTQHTEIILDSDILQYLPKVVWHFDEPLADPASLPTYLLCKEVSKSVKIALSGEGGDEVFGGYDSFNSIDKLLKLKIIPAPVRTYILSKLCFILSPLFDYPKKQKLALASELFSDLNNFNKAYLKLFYFPFDSLSKAPLLYNKYNFNDISLETEIERNFFTSTNLKNQTLNYYFNEWLPNDLLMKADKMSMAHGLEIRTPFLDNNLIAYFASIDNSYKKNRRIFKKTISKLLPKKILEKKKQGFTLPLSNWFKNTDFVSRINPFLESLKSRNIFNKQALVNITGNLNSFKNDHRIWVILNFEIWCQLYLDNKKIENIKI